MGTAICYFSFIVLRKGGFVFVGVFFAFNFQKFTHNVSSYDFHRFLNYLGVFSAS